MVDKQGKRSVLPVEEVVQRGVCKSSSCPTGLTGRVAEMKRGTTRPFSSHQNALCAINGKGNHFREAFRAQRQHHQTIHAQRNTRTVWHANLQRLDQIVVDGLLR